MVITVAELFSCLLHPRALEMLVDLATYFWSELWIVVKMFCSVGLESGCEGAWHWLQTPCHSGPIRGQYPGHVITLDQSEASIQTPCHSWHNIITTSQFSSSSFEQHQKPKRWQLQLQRALSWWGCYVAWWRHGHLDISPIPFRISSAPWHPGYC